MTSSWTGWLAFLVLAALVMVTSCQAYMYDTPDNGSAQTSGASG